jgi:hypothetical protein
LKPIAARDFDQKFGAGAGVSGDVDWAKARRPNLELKRASASTFRHGSSKRSTERPGASA